LTPELAKQCSIKHSSEILKLDKIDEVESIFFDERSKLVFSKIIDNRKKHNFIYSDIFDTDQYFIPEVISSFSDDDIYVDCGPYTGYEIDKFIEFCPNFKEIHAFEPDITRYNYLKNKFEGKNNPKIRVYPYACYNQNIEIEFAYNEFATAKRIDDIINEMSFIKMDIEGAELEALEGSKELIKKYKPTLAISVYHKPNDIIDIPLYIQSLVSSYVYIIRHHSVVGNETVLYCIDSNKML